MRYSYLLLITIHTVFLSCSIGDFAGKGGSETTNGVTASICNTDGTPAVGSIVRLRRSNYLSQNIALPKMAIDSLTSVTDSQGSFFINDIEPGSYCIEVQNVNKTVLLTFSVNNSDTAILETDTLRPYAIMSGVVDTTGSSGSQLYAHIRGLERITKVEKNGTFTFNDLPEGSLDLVISKSVPKNVTKEVLNINTLPGDTVSIEVIGSSIYSGYIYLNTAIAAIPSTTVLTDFPLLIRLDSSSFDFAQALPGGDDIYFVKKDNTALSHEVEKWDAISRQAAIWVRIDTIQGGKNDQFIIMRWGETDVVSQSNGAAVFDTGYGFASVYHLNENPSSGTGAIKDRTVNANHGTPGASMTYVNSITGISGTGLMFNGISDSIATGSLNLNGNYSLSCWVKASQSPCINWRFIIREGSYTLWYDTDTGGVRSEHYTDLHGWRGFYQDTPDSVFHQLSLDTWYYLVSTFDGNKIRLYVNGALIDSTISIMENPHSTEEPLLIGGRVNEFFKGVMDEVRIERTARSEEWIRLSFLNQQLNSKLTILKLR